MELYTKATSERATKGQGGNEFIEIELLAMIDKISTVVGNVSMIRKEKEILIKFDGGDYDIEYIIQTKDKKQKTVKCGFCGKINCASLFNEETICSTQIPF